MIDELMTKLLDKEKECQKLKMEAYKLKKLVVFLHNSNTNLRQKIGDKDQIIKIFNESDELLREYIGIVSIEVNNQNEVSFEDDPEVFCANVGKKQILQQLKRIVGINQDEDLPMDHRTILNAQIDSILKEIEAKETNKIIECEVEPLSESVVEEIAELVAEHIVAEKPKNQFCCEIDSATMELILKDPEKYNELMEQDYAN